MARGSRRNQRPTVATPGVAGDTAETHHPVQSEDAPATIPMSVGAEVASGLEEFQDDLAVARKFREAGIDPEIALHIAEGRVRLAQAPEIKTELRAAYEQQGMEFTERLASFYVEWSGGGPRERQRARLINLAMNYIRAHHRIEMAKPGRRAA